MTSASSWLSGYRRWVQPHWDTAFLAVAAIVFFWQVTQFFMPVTVELPAMPKQVEPMATVLVANPIGADSEEFALTAMSDSDMQALVERKSTSSAKPKRYPPKKPKPVLKPGSIHLNSVSIAQLDLLPGVGPKLAKRIIDYRNQHGPFVSLTDLKNVKGIGDKNFAKMSVYLAL